MSAMKNRKRLALALGAVGLVAAVQVANATHVRPKGATPLRVSLTTAYNQCTSPNNTHGPPLAFQSCSPPVQRSNFVTVGTPDANGAAANSVGYLLIKVKPTSPEDVLISGEITDVRCKPATAAAVCGSANAADGPDYSGQLQSNATLRLTDHFNGPNHDEPGTVQDIPFPVGFNCVNTADVTIGATCTVDTYNPLPGPNWFDGQRVVSEMTQLQVSDGGPDGFVSSEPQDNTVFAVQGIFIP